MTNQELAISLLQDTLDLFGRRGFSEHEKDVAMQKLSTKIPDVALALAPKDEQVKRAIVDLKKQYEKYLKI